MLPFCLLDIKLSLEVLYLFCLSDITHHLSNLLISSLQSRYFTELPLPKLNWLTYSLPNSSLLPTSLNFSLNCHSLLFNSRLLAIITDVSNVSKNLNHFLVCTSVLCRFISTIMPRFKCREVFLLLNKTWIKLEIFLKYPFIVEKNLKIKNKICSFYIST